MINFSPPRVYKSSQSDTSELKRLLKKCPIPTITSNTNTNNNTNTNTDNASSKSFHYEYGTAGFRYHHSLLPPIMIRMGILATLRSSSLSPSSSSSSSECVGMMITASHNTEEDNGIKLSDSDGGMLHPSWEKMATKIANANEDVLLSWIDKYNDKHTNTRTNTNTHTHTRTNAVVHIGRDTRSHSSSLAQLAIRTIIAMGGTVIDHGLITTPQLHYYVLRSNCQNMPNSLLYMSSAIGFERDYISGIVNSYITLLGTKIISGTSTNTSSSTSTNITNRKMLVDCACGIGGLKVPIVNKMLRQCEQEGGIIPNNLSSVSSVSSVSSSIVELIPFNMPGDGPLNEQCGAEYVQKQQKVPKVYTNGMVYLGGGGNGSGSGNDDGYDNDGNDGSKLSSMEYVASLDGDADRIVFHYKDGNGKLVLLDGDKIAVLVSSFVQEELDSLSSVVQDAKDIKCGVVQTAYANGSSTNYLKNNVKTNIVISKTGVKYVHATAHSNFDVGTYFEANGHGTVLFGQKFYTLLAKAETALLGTCRSNRANVAWQRLRVLPRLINQAIGDALSDLLLVDAILYIKGWNLRTWNGLYDDLPSRQCKVKVKDRSLVVTNDNETMAIKPTSLQPALQSAMDGLSSGMNNSNTSTTTTTLAPPRTFVRPSGTENVVRVYAEASTQKDADALASEAAALVYKLCNGVGDIPNFIGKSNL